MAEKLRWEIELADKLSTISDKMASALDRLGQRLENSEKKSQALNLEIGKLSALGGSVNLDKISSFLKGGAIAGAFGIGAGVSALTDGLGKAVDLVGALVDGAARFADETLKASSDYEKLYLSQRLLLGEDDAKQLRAFTGAVGNKGIALDADVLEGLLQPLLVAGARGEDLRKLTAAAGDIAALTNNRTTIEGALGAFERVITGGRLDNRTVRAFGLQASEVFGNLGKALGVSPEEALKRAGSGKLAPQVLLDSVFTAIAAKVPEGLGSGAAAAANTVESKLRKLREIPGNILKKFAESDGFKSFGGFLDRLYEKLDPDGPTGQRIIAALQRLGDKITSFLDGIDGDAIDTVVDTVVGLGEAVVEALPSLRQFGEDVGNLVVGLGKLASYGAKSFDFLTAFGSKAGGAGGAYDIAQRADRQAKIDAERDRAVSRLVAGKDLASAEALTAKLSKQFGQGVVGAETTRALERLREYALQSAATNAAGDLSKTLTIGLPGAFALGAAGEATGRAVGGGIKRGANDALEIHSPSRVFAEIGEQSGVGFDVGFRRSRAADSAEAVVPGAGARGAVTITFGNIILAPGTPEEQAAALRQAVREQMLGFVEEQLEVGGI